MVGNPSAPAAALFVLALHATLLLHAPCHVVAGQASSTGAEAVEYEVEDWSNNNTSRSRRKHLRRSDGSTNTNGAGNDDDDENFPQRTDIDGREMFRHILESSGVAFLQEDPYAAIQDHIKSLASTSIPTATDTVSSDDWMQFDIGTAGNSDSDCLTRTWHPDLYSPYTACSNSLSHPSSWNDILSIHEEVMFDSSQDCCDAITYFLFLGDDDDDHDYGHYGECSVIDTCGGGGAGSLSSSATTTATKAKAEATDPARQRRRLGCTPLGWHVDAKSDRGCTNSDEFPPPWSNPGLKEKMFYPNPTACCNFFFGGMGSDCPVVDSCGTPPGPAPGSPDSAYPDSTGGGSQNCPWHVDMVSQQGCTNDSTYPEEWSRPPANSMMFHATGDACCQKMFASNKDCPQTNRGCDGPVVRPGPKTPPPTFRPTRKPVTQRPTPHPTPEPTPEPTVTPLIFYLSEATGMCVSNYEKEKPEWIKEEFTVYKWCCQEARDTMACLRAQPTKIGTFDLGTLSPTDAPPLVWYADPSTGECVNSEDTPIAAWVSGTYQDYKRCCIMAARDEDKCLENDPNKLKLYGADRTATPTATPDPIYYKQDSTATCVNKYDVPMPYKVDTFEDYDECCATSWNKAKCMDLKPTMEPTQAPSLSPSTAWPTQYAICPDEYTDQKTYGNGDEVAMNEVVYRCRRPPHSVYCNRSEFRPNWDDPGPEKVEEDTETASRPGHIGIPIGVISFTNQEDEGEKVSELWKDAWERLYVCANPPAIPEPITPSPTFFPTTSSPTCKTTRWHPGEMSRKICTNADEYPETWNIEPFLTTYFADTAEECCDKFYPGKRCRIREVCDTD